MAQSWPWDSQIAVKKNKQKKQKKNHVKVLKIDPITKWRWGKQATSEYESFTLLGLLTFVFDEL